MPGCFVPSVVAEEVKPPAFHAIGTDELRDLVWASDTHALIGVPFKGNMATSSFFFKVADHLKVMLEERGYQIVKT